MYICAYMCICVSVCILISIKCSGRYTEHIHAYVCVYDIDGSYQSRSVYYIAFIYNTYSKL